MPHILALDPGKTNFGYAVLQYRDTKKGREYRLREHGHIKNTVNDLKPVNLLAAFDTYRQEILSIINRFNITEVVAERFVSRGLLGSLSEYVCNMQGITASIPGLTVFQLVMPATWKAAFNKNFKLNDFYKVVKKEAGMTPHQLDAVCIGLYFLSGKELFNAFSSFRGRKQFLQAAKETNAELLPVKSRVPVFGKVQNPKLQKLDKKNGNRVSRKRSTRDNGVGKRNDRRRGAVV